MMGVVSTPEAFSSARLGADGNGEAVPATTEWQLEQVFEVNSTLPLAALPPPPELLGPLDPPLDPPLEGGGELLGALDPEVVNVEFGNAPRPTLEAPLVSVPAMAITATITTIPMMVPTSAATSTLIIARRTLPA
jgi:hypothetical protein